MRFSTKLTTPTMLASALLLSACTSERKLDTAPTQSTGSNGIQAGTLEAKAVRPTLTLRNTTEFVIGYMAVDKDQAVIALYPPCGQNCPTLRQGESIALHYTSIGGYAAASREARVMWWKYVRRADGSLSPEGGVQTVTVRLD